MPPTPRELVHQTLAFENPQRAPRQLWVLPWAGMHHGTELEAIRAAFPDDIVHAPAPARVPAPEQGDIYAVGTYVDPWGCRFENIQAGVIGEVKQALVADWQADRPKIHVPRELLTLDVEAVNRFCGGTDRFVLSSCLARPFEQLQFIRGTAELYTDLLVEPKGFAQFFSQMHQFYCELFHLWAKTDVDALMFMDDWGSQSGLLIDPELWRRWFMPCYRDYIEIAHGAGKKAFMHSDGHVAAIYPQMVELGLDAFNSQVFCMGPETLAAFAGQITFWGEIDRQHALPEGTPDSIAADVSRLHEHLWRGGGCIAQCEFGAGAKPENVQAVFAAWDALV